jgi:hypothetical protein
MQDFYRVFPGYEAAVNDNAMFICHKLVTDMIYKSRVSQNMVWKAQQHENVQKSDMRNLRLTPEQYMEVNTRQFIFLRLHLLNLMFLYGMHLMTCRCLRGGVPTSLTFGGQL